MAEASNRHASQLVVQAMQCQETLKDLLSKSLQNDLEHQESHFLSRQLANFNVWCSKIGVNKSSQRSLDYRLKDLPERRKLIAGLLEVLSRCLQSTAEPELLEPEIFDGQAETEAQSEIQKREKSDDEDSDGSSWCPDALSSSDESDTDIRPNRIWERIEDTIDRLHGHARLIEVAGIKHRQARIERFKNKPDQKQVYGLFRRIAQEKVEHHFTRSPLWMKERIAESFARRRIRFEYLKQHQKKLGFGLNNEPRYIGASLPPLQTENQPKETVLTPFTQADTQINQQDPRDTIPHALDHSVMLSATENTRYDTTSPLLVQVFEGAESVASVTMRHRGFPQQPKLHGSDSFTCPYCCLEFPSVEAEGISWSQHVMRDFEPYFCVLEDCSEPFDVPNSFEGLLNHIHDSHVSARYHFEVPDGSDQEFEDRQLFEHFLQEKMQIPRLQLPLLVDMSRKKKPFLFETCYFCGGYPDVVETRFPDPATPDAQAEMRRHIKQHMQEIALYLPPFRDDLAEDASEEDDVSDNAVGTQSHGLDELSAVTWSSTSQQERRYSQDQIESANTVDEQVHSNSKIGTQDHVPSENYYGLKWSKQNQASTGGGKLAQGPVESSDEQHNLMYRARQDHNGTLEYDYNYEDQRHHIAKASLYPQEDNRLAEELADRSAPASYLLGFALGNPDEWALPSIRKGKSSDPRMDYETPDQANHGDSSSSVLQTSQKTPHAEVSTTPAYPNDRANDRDDGSQILARKGVPWTHTVDQAGPSRSGSVDPSSPYDDSYQQEDTDVDRVEAPEGVFDPRYRIHASSKFEPGEIFKAYWSEPQGTEGNNLSRGFAFSVCFRRYLVIANDLGHCCCVPILTYDGRGCKKSGVRPGKHGIIHEVGRQARLLDGEPKLGYPPIQAQLYEEGERLASESRVNYSKLVTIEHDLSVFFIGSLAPGSVQTALDAVDDCWGKKSRHPKPRD